MNAPVSTPVSTPEAAAKPLIEIVEIAKISRPMRFREKLSRTTIDEYATAMAAYAKEGSGKKFPPIVLYRESSDTEALLLSDGANRLEAVIKNGGKTIEAEIRIGSAFDCLIHAVSSATEFGLRYSTRDKRYQCELFITQYPKMKDREIGRAIGVDGKTVAASRERVREREKEKAAKKAAKEAAAENPQDARPVDPEERIVEKLTAKLEAFIVQWPDSRHKALRELLTKWNEALAVGTEVQP